MASSTSSVDGLISGLNTTQIIDQLMQVAAAPQTLLKTQVSTKQTVLQAYQGINSKFAALQKAADALTGDAAWNAVSASSSSSNVTVSTSDGASVGSFTFDVVQTARPEVRMSTSTYAMSDVVVPSGQLTVSTSATPLDVGDGSLSSVISAINGSSLGLRAVAVQVSSGQYMLQVSSTATGAAQAFDLGITTTEATQARDATIMVDTTAISRPTNTFSDVVPGVSFTVSKDNDTGVTISLASDAEGLAKKVQAMVDAANAATDLIATATAYNASTKTGGPLIGDSTVRMLQQRLLDAVTSGVGGQSTSQVGVAVDRSGKVTFDKATFLSYYRSNPTQTRALLDSTTGFTPSQPLTGTISVARSDDSAAAAS